MPCSISTHRPPAIAPVLAIALRRGVLIIAAVAAYFLLKEHTAHVAGYLPFLLLAACPLMHLFMHRGHGHGGHDHAARQGKEGAAASKEQKQ